MGGWILSYSINGHPPFYFAPHAKQFNRASAAATGRPGPALSSSSSRLPSAAAARPPADTARSPGLLSNRGRRATSGSPAITANARVRLGVVVAPRRRAGSERPVAQRVVRALVSYRQALQYRSIQIKFNSVRFTTSYRSD